MFLHSRVVAIPQIPRVCRAASFGANCIRAVNRARIVSSRLSETVNSRSGAISRRHNESFVAVDVDHGLPAPLAGPCRNVLYPTSCQSTPKYLGRIPSLCPLVWNNSPIGNVRESPVVRQGYRHFFVSECRNSIADGLGCLWRHSGSNHGANPCSRCCGRVPGYAQGILQRSLELPCLSHLHYACEVARFSDYQWWSQV